MRALSLALRFFPHALSTASADIILSGGNLEEIKEKVALDKDRAGFQVRETRALTWTLDCLTANLEFMQFIEGVPLYLDHQRNSVTMQYQPSQIMADLLRHDDYAFARKQLSSLVEQPHPTERSICSVLDLIGSLARRSLFPYNLSTQAWHKWDVIPVMWLFPPFQPPLEPQKFPSLSSAMIRTKFFVILQCSEDIITLDRHSAFRPEYLCYVLDWIHDLCFMDNDNYPPILRGKEFEEFKKFLGPGPLHISPDVPKVTAALASCILTGLCHFLLKEICDLSKPLEMEPLVLFTMIHRCNKFTSFLTSGSPFEQQAYAAAVWLITIGIVSRHETSVVNDHSSVLISHDLLTSLLEPLVNITNADALQTVRKILSSSVWWEDGFISQVVLNHLQDSQILRDPVIASIYWVKSSYITEDTMASRLEQCPSTLAGLPSTLQNQFIDHMNQWFGNPHLPQDEQSRSFTAALFRLATTLDDVKAVTHATKHIERFILQVDVLYVDEWTKVQHFLGAKEALERLQETAAAPGFVYQSLVLRLDE
ncbi:hypothetical protein C8J56DRAFT_1032754 [Mycena floridula]|nr:hypothetical protein C8J56DRAFT_1032754 [Mycena floridula]